MKQATIKITNLRLRTFIGFNPDERKKQQDVVLNIKITHEVNEAIFQDIVSASLDYKVITKSIIKHVENGHFLLLEKLTQDILEICHTDNLVTSAEVTIDKPHALRFADSVSITMEYQRPFKNIKSEKCHEDQSHSFSQAS